jgi:hypothetical protein
MLQQLKQQIFSNWHPMRWILLGMSVVLAYNYFVYGASVSGVLALFLGFQAITNTGCLMGQCAPSLRDGDTSGFNEHEVVFEEVKDELKSK